MADASNGRQDEQVAERAKRAAGLTEEQRQMEAAEPEQLEAYPLGSLEGDAKVTLRSLVKGGEPVEFTASMRAAEFPLRTGLVDFRKSGRALVTYEAQKIEVVVKREDGEVAGWKERQVLRPTFLEPVKGDLPEMVEAWFDRVMEESPEVGGALADRIAAKAAARLSVA